MIRKRLDDRIRTLLERSIATNERSFLCIVGDHGKDQVPNLHAILSRASSKRPSVLWCYKSELGFSTHRKKRIKKLKREKDKGLLAAETADNFELFISQTDIQWCYYRETNRILGQTFGVLVLQDFEAMTPNLLARTIETVSGGGLVVLLLRTVKSLQQLYHMSMDVHSRYRTESAGDVVPRFNERFILSLAKCRNCLVCDDELNVLPLCKSACKSLSAEKQLIHKQDGHVILKENEQDLELKQLKESLIDTPHVGVLVELAKTLDQAKAVLVFLEACTEKHATTVALTAARGRGKSSAIGLCLAGAIALGFSNIAVTAPEPENLVAVFDFLKRGLGVLKYQEHADYTITYNTSKGRDQIKCITGIQVHRTHRQLIQYHPPSEKDKFVSAEIVAIDEAAAIPLPIVRSLMHGDRLTFMSSTINGYEGTGRALSLKLIKELRDAKGTAMQAANEAAAAIAGPRTKKGEAKVHEQRWNAAAEAVSTTEKLTGSLREIELSTPIRYAQGDPVESWLNKLLCLNATFTKLSGGAPAPAECELYSVDRDALFSYHKLSEAFLQKIMGLYTSAHYKNTPNDLQMLSDAPAHAVFVLLSPSAEQDADSLPDVLAVIQVAYEGRISRKAVEAQLARGHRSAGDLIPWTISQQFSDSKFAQLSGARIVRIAVHPSLQGMGYGSRAMELLYRFYNGEMINLVNDNLDDDEGEEEKEASSESESESEENGGGSGLRGERLKPRKELPPLLLPMTEIETPPLDWIGTSFGLTYQLHKFWSRVGMKMLYLRQTKNDLTGEHSAIMLRALPGRSGFDGKWLDSFIGDVRRRFINLLGGAFSDLDIRLAISVLDNLGDQSEKAASDSDGRRAMTGKIGADELEVYLTPYDLKRLELYGRNLCDHHLVTDLLPTVSRLYFTGRFGSDLSLSSVQSALMCGIGLQNRTVDSLTSDLGLPSNQVLAMFNKAVRKLSIALNGVIEEKEKRSLLHGDKREKAEKAVERMRDVAAETLDEDVKDAAKEAMEVLRANDQANLPSEIANDPELMQYVVKGSEEQWKSALKDRDVEGTGTIQIQSVREKRKAIEEDDIEKEAKRTDSAKKPGKKNKKPKKRKSRD